MEKKSANEILRQIIREEVTKIIRQELPKILSENKVITEQTKKKQDVPLTLNSTPTPKFEDIKFNKSNPMAAFLNDTAQHMLAEGDMNFSTADVGPGMHPAMVMQPKEASVGSINDMFATARPSSNVDMVQINAVPDFSAMMEKMGIE
jgi:hypothetical protein